MSVGHSKSAVEKINHCKRSKQVHSKDQLQVQEQVNDIICITFEVDIKWIVYSSIYFKLIENEHKLDILSMNTKMYLKI